MFNVIDDTIAAISSAIGHGPRGIVRLCGPLAIPIADRLFVPEAAPLLRDRPGHAHMLGRLRLMPPQPSPDLPAEAYLFRAPRSYTQQDIVELHTLSAPPILSMILHECFAQGARLAEPGEFTARAFFAGQLDLSEVEGVAALIHAESDAQLRAGEQLLHGALSSRAAELQNQLSDVLALVEADIDFAEESIAFITPGDLRQRLALIADDLRQLLDSSPKAERIEVLPRIMLLGPPNVGKSSLLNRLTGLDRAICSPMPGTTRDVLTAPLELPHSEAILVDGAGLGLNETLIDRLADEAVHRAVHRAELILFVVDAAESPMQPKFELLADLPRRPLIVLVNKVDQVAPERLRDRLAALAPPRPAEVLPVSARTGAGCDEVRAAVARILHADGIDPRTDLITLNARHRAALDGAAAAIDRALDVARSAGETLDVAELIAMELREAGEQLGHIVGQVVTDDLLGRVFAHFCIGK